MPQEPPDKIDFDDDTTIRWSCREGDYVVWFRCRDVFAATAVDLSVMDVWELRDGDYVTVTNRMADLPSWFELYPDEVQGRAVWEMKKKLDAGWEPGERMDGPNLWRVLCGDRLVWAGPSRGGDRAPRVLAMVAVRSNALAAGESNRPDYDPLTFGSVVRGVGSEPATRLLRTAVDAAKELGPPRELAADGWAIG